MASIPPCGFNCRMQQLHSYLKDNKKSFLIYSLFYLLLIEVASYFIRDVKNYACYWYPLLTQIGYFLVVFSIFLWNERLHFCFRKNIAVLFLSLYYFFGSVSLIFDFSNSTYAFYTGCGLLGISVITFILSTFKND